MNEVILQLLLREGAHVSLSMFPEQMQREHLIEAGRRMFETNPVKALPYFQRAGIILYKDKFLELADQYSKMGEKDLAIAIYEVIGEGQVATFLRSNV